MEDPGGELLWNAGVKAKHRAATCPGCLHLSHVWFPGPPDDAVAVAAAAVSTAVVAAAAAASIAVVDTVAAVAHNVNTASSTAG